MKKPKFIYCDIGGVVVLDFSGTDKFQSMMDDLDVPDLKREVFVDIFNNEHALCAGQWGREIIECKMRELVDITLDEGYNIMQDFVDRFEPNPELVGIMQDIRQQLPVGLLTNMYEGMLQEIFSQNLLIANDWDVVVDSWEQAVAKPQLEIYKLAERLSGYQEDDILFIDNKQINLDAASELGWQTFLYDPTDVSVSNKRLRELLLS